MSQSRLSVLQPRLQRGRVRGDPAGEDCGVGQDDADLGALAVDRAAARAALAGAERCGRAEVAPPAAADVAGAEELPPPPPLELQAASANAAATPIAATCTLLLRMQSRLSVCGAALALRARTPPNVVRANISDEPRVQPPDDTNSLPESRRRVNCAAIVRPMITLW